MLDLETTGGLSPANLTQWTLDYLDRVKALTGRAPAIYGSSYFLRTALKANSKLAAYPLWIASWTSNASPSFPAGWSSWTFWQYTSSATVKGVPGRVDANRFNGTVSDLRGLAGLGLDKELTHASVTVTLSATRTRPNRSVTMSGTVTPAHAGQVIYRQGFYSGKWHTWATTRQAADGSYKFKITPTVVAVNKYRVYVPASGGIPATASQTVTLTVR